MQLLIKISPRRAKYGIPFSIIILETDTSVITLTNTYLIYYNVSVKGSAFYSEGNRDLKFPRTGISPFSIVPTSIRVDR